MGTRLQGANLTPITNIYGTENADHIVGTLIDEQIWGLTGDDFLSGQGGHDWLIGGDGNDILVGDYGDDVLIGESGNDAMFGGYGNDYCRVDSIGDSVHEIAGAGLDTVGSRVDWKLGAHVENLELFGSPSTGGAIRGTGNNLANEIWGNSLNNVLNGLGGHDILRAGYGNDRVNGGAGNDRYLFKQADVNLAWVDTVRIGRGEDDRIGLRQIDAIAGAGNDTFTFVGSRGFSGTAGELRYEYFGRWSALGNSFQETGELFRLLGDVDGDGNADFAILVQVQESFPEDALGLNANDFWL